MARASRTSTPRKTGPVIGRLISRKDHPITFKYDGKEVRLSPRQTLNNVEQAKLDDGVPHGAVYVPQRNQ